MKTQKGHLRKHPVLGNLGDVNNQVILILLIVICTLQCNGHRGVFHSHNRLGLSEGRIIHTENINGDGGNVRLLSGCSILRKKALTPKKEGRNKQREANSCGDNSAEIEIDLKEKL